MMNNHLTWKTKEGRYWVGAGKDTPPKDSKLLGVYYPRGSSVGGSSMINKQCTYVVTFNDIPEGAGTDERVDGFQLTATGTIFRS